MKINYIQNLLCVPVLLVSALLLSALLLSALLLSALLLSAQPGQSQPFTAGTPEVLIDGGDSFFMNPVWSPDGERIAFTSGEYRGIWTISQNGDDLTRLTGEDAAGFGFSWSSDGSKIVARTARYDKQFRLHAVKLYDVATGSETVLSDYCRERIGLPQWTDFDQRVAVPARESIRLLDTGVEPAERQKRMLDELVILSRDDRIESRSLTDDDVAVIREFQGQRVLNLTPSPDANKIAFQVIGEGLFVMDSNGENLRNLGRAEQPVWMPDGEWLIATVTVDDGHHITGSEIYAIEIASGERHHLTAHTDIIALNPTVSPDGRRLAFGDSETGRIYTMTIR